MPIFAAVVKAGTDEIVDAYHIADPRFPDLGKESKPVANRDEMNKLVDDLTLKYPHPDYQIVQGGAGNVRDLIAYSRTADYEYDNYK